MGLAYYCEYCQKKTESAICPEHNIIICKGCGAKKCRNDHCMMCFETVLKTGMFSRAATKFFCLHPDAEFTMRQVEAWAAAKYKSVVENETAYFEIIYGYLRDHGWVDHSDDDELEMIGDDVDRDLYFDHETMRKLPGHPEYRRQD